MFRIAICDDENYFAEELKERISSYMLEKGVVFEIDLFRSGEALIELGMEVAQYTVIFLDINMDRMNGITTAEGIRKVCSEVFIVFVTAYVDYSLEGYRLDVIRYLLKGSANLQGKIDECMDAVMDKINYSVTKRKYDFREGQKEILLERLLYVTSRLHTLEFHVMEDTVKVYTMYEKLNVLEKSLPENDFVRVHQSYLVNVKYIKKIIRFKAILTNGLEISIPKGRYTPVRQKFIAWRGEV